MGPVKKSVFSNISLSKSVGVQVHKLYINLAIAVILMLFSSLSVSDLSLNVCPVRRGSSCILRNENQLLVHNFKVSVASKYLLLHDMDEY